MTEKQTLVPVSFHDIAVMPYAMDILNRDRRDHVVRTLEREVEVDGEPAILRDVVMQMFPKAELRTIYAHLFGVDEGLISPTGQPTAATIALNDADRRLIQCGAEFRRRGWLPMIVLRGSRHDRDEDGSLSASATRVPALLGPAHSQAVLTTLEDWALTMAAISPVMLVDGARFHALLSLYEPRLSDHDLTYACAALVQLYATGVVECRALEGAGQPLAQEATARRVLQALHQRYLPTSVDDQDFQTVRTDLVMSFLGYGDQEGHLDLANEML